MRDIDAQQAHLPLPADRDRMDLCADGGVAAALSPTLLKRDRARGALRQRRAPARHPRGGVERLDHVGFVGKVGARDQLATIEIRVLAGRVRKLVDEALAIEIMRWLTHAAPRADGN